MCFLGQCKDFFLSFFLSFFFLSRSTHFQSFLLPRLVPAANLKETGTQKTRKWCGWRLGRYPGACWAIIDGHGRDPGPYPKNEGKPLNKTTARAQICLLFFFKETVDLQC